MGRPLWKRDGVHWPTVSFLITIPNALEHFQNYFAHSFTIPLEEESDQICLHLLLSHPRVE